MGRFAYRATLRFDEGMAPRFVTILTGRNMPKIPQPKEPEPSTINEKTIADFTRVVEKTGILECDWATEKPTDETPSARSRRQAGFQLGQTGRQLRRQTALVMPGNATRI